MRSFALLLFLVLSAGARPGDEWGDLLEELADRDAYVGELAGKSLVKQGKAAVPHLIAALGSKSALLRARAAGVLGAIGADASEAMAALTGLRDDADQAVRSAAAEALRRIRSARPNAPAQPLAQLVDGPREELLRALQAREAPGPAATAVPLLLHILEKRDDGLKAAAAQLFSHYGREARFAVPALVALGRDGSWPQRFAVADAMAGIGAAAVRPLFEAFLARAGMAPTGAPEVFFQLGPAVVPVALRELSGNNREARQAACVMLFCAGRGAQPALPALVRALHDSAGRVRRAAADALGAIGSAEAVPALVMLAADADRRARLQAVRALGWIVRSAAATYRIATLRARKPERDAIALGQRWLAGHQDESGVWDCAGFFKHDPNDDRCDGAGQIAYSVGVSGLALLALQEGGAERRHEAAIRRGLRYLVASQDKQGCYGLRAGSHFLYNHAIATLAMCVAYGETRNPLYGASAQRSVDFAAAARSPQLGWRYVPGAADSDTSLTGWMIHALHAGARAGLRIDPKALAGTLRYLDRATDAATGRTGYRIGTFLSARPTAMTKQFPEQKSWAMTAAGALSRLHAGQRPEHPLVALGAQQCLSILPNWDRDNGWLDMDYWLAATRLLGHVGKKPWRLWKGPLIKAVTTHQHPQGSGARTGSWDPIGPWGPDGGRVYSTSLMVLALKTVDGRIWPQRFRAPRAPALRPALVVLNNARSHEDQRISAAAANALSALQ